MTVVNCVTKAATFNVLLNTNGVHNGTIVLYNYYVIYHLCRYVTARLINPNVNNDFHIMLDTIILCVYCDKEKPYVTNRKNIQEPSLSWINAIIFYFFDINVQSTNKFKTFMNDYILRKLLDVITYSISQEICTRFCCALLCCGYAIVHKEFT